MAKMNISKNDRSKKASKTKYVIPAINSKSRLRKLVDVVQVLQNTQNLVISRCFAENGYVMCIGLQRKCIPLFYSLNLVFSDVLVLVTAVVICLSLFIIQAKILSHKSTLGCGLVQLCSLSSFERQSGSRDCTVD